MQDSYNKSYRRSRRRNAPETKPNPFIYFLESIVEGRLSGCMINALVVGLVLLVLVLPPISLVDRIMGIGYERIGVNGGSISKEGLELNFPPEGLSRAFRVQAEVIPRSEFLEGAAGNTLIQAAENIPPNLTLRSPYYRLRWRGTPPEAVFARVPLPRDIEDVNTADLYAWNGEAWAWLPNLKMPTERVIETTLDDLPQSFVVMSTYPVNPSVATDYRAGTVLPDNLSDTIVELNPVGLYLSDNGAIEDTLAEMPSEVENSTMLVIPTLRNWYDDGSVRADLIDNLLVDADLRQAHLENIVDLVQRNAYQGIDLDYRNVSPDLRQEFAAFIQELGSALPEDKILAVRVGLPRQVSGQDWETDGYDWRAIGQAADVVKIPAFPDPRFYVPGGQMDVTLNWATGQINRYKIQLVLSTLSTEEVNGVLRPISYDQALQPIGEVIIVGERQTANPGEQVGFTLNGLEASTGIQFDAQTGAYWFAYLDQQDVQRTVYLENAASLARKLQFVAQYNLRGVAVENLLSQRQDAQIWTVMDQFLDLVIPPVESKYSVVWRVQAEDGGVVAEEVVDLSNPGYTWTAPQGGGTFQINASIASDHDVSAAVPRGSVSLLVATPTPRATPTPQPSPTPEPTEEPTRPPPPPPAPPAAVAQAAPAPEPEPEPEPAPSGPAPVAAAKGNLPFDYGIQVDPNGNDQGNIGLIRGMGFNWVKFQMAWKDVEGSPGDFGWGGWDGTINTYSGAGIKILLSIPKAPDWARPPDDDKSVEGPPQDPNLYAKFVAAVAERYRGKVQAIEIWNEQNLYYEAGGQGRINPAAYTELLKLSYNAIKAVNPDMIVVTGALTPTGAPPPVAMDDVEYLRQMYANGAKGFFDAVGSHPSGFANSPDALYQGGDFDPARGYDDHRSFFFRNTMEEYRRVMVENGDGAKTIWPTEFGWPVWRFTGDARFIFAQQNSLEQQAQFTVRAYQLAKEWGWVGTMFLWNLDYNVTAANTELANFGIVGTPAYDALSAMPK